MRGNARQQRAGSSSRGRAGGSPRACPCRSSCRPARSATGPPEHPSDRRATRSLVMTLAIRNTNSDAAEEDQPAVGEIRLQQRPADHRRVEQHPHQPHARQSPTATGSRCRPATRGDMPVRATQGRRAVRRIGGRACSVAAAVSAAAATATGAAGLAMLVASAGLVHHQAGPGRAGSAAPGRDCARSRSG